MSKRVSTGTTVAGWTIFTGGFLVLAVVIILGICQLLGATGGWLNSIPSEYWAIFDALMVLWYATAMIRGKMTGLGVVIMALCIYLFVTNSFVTTVLAPHFGF